MEWSSNLIMKHAFINFFDFFFQAMESMIGDNDNSDSDYDPNDEIDQEDTDYMGKKLTKWELFYGYPVSLSLVYMSLIRCVM